MSARENKQRVEEAFAGMATGDASALLALLTDDVRWTVTGTTAISRTLEGREALAKQLLGALQARMQGLFKLRATRVIADDEAVVVEARGDGNVTKQGKRYDNTYCFVFTMRGNLICAATEYLDTELLTASLLSPAK